MQQIQQAFEFLCALLYFFQGPADDFGGQRRFFAACDGGIGAIHLVEVFHETGFVVIEPFLYFLLGDVVLFAVLGPHLGAVNGDKFFSEESGIIQYPVEKPENGFEGFAVGFDGSEIADGVVGGFLTAGEPHQFDVACAFLFEPARGAHAVEIAVDIDFQQQTGVIGRRAAMVGADVGKPELLQIDGVDEGLHDAHEIVGGDQFVERGGEKAELLAVLSGAVAHGVFFGEAAGRRWVKYSWLGERVVGVMGLFFTI